MNKQTLLDSIKSVVVRLDPEADGNSVALLNRAHAALADVEDRHFAAAEAAEPAIVVVAPAPVEPSPPLFTPKAS